MAPEFSSGPSFLLPARPQFVVCSAWFVMQGCLYLTVRGLPTVASFTGLPMSDCTQLTIHATGRSAWFVMQGCLYLTVRGCHAKKS